MLKKIKYYQSINLVFWSNDSCVNHLLSNNVDNFYKAFEAFPIHETCGVFRYV